MAKNVKNANKKIAKEDSLVKDVMSSDVVSSETVFNLISKKVGNGYKVSDRLFLTEKELEELKKSDDWVLLVLFFNQHLEEERATLSPEMTFSYLMSDKVKYMFEKKVKDI